MITHKGTQTIHTQRLTLRKVLPDDIAAIYGWMRDPEVTRYEDWIPHDSAAYTKGFLSYLTGDYASEQTYCWGIALEGEVIGLILVANVTEWNGMLGYWLKRDCWSKGYATEAAAAVLQYMFTEVKVNRIEGKHSIKNPASGAVLRKIGMQYRGHVKAFEYYTSKCEWHDCDLYAITREQFDAGGFGTRPYGIE